MCVSQVTNVETTHYILGSAAGPHPYPMMVRDFQSVIGRETRQQCQDKWGGLPDIVMACVGGGSNAMGIFNEFVDDNSVRLIGVEVRQLDTVTCMWVSIHVGHCSRQNTRVCCTALNTRVCSTTRYACCDRGARQGKAVTLFSLREIQGQRLAVERPVRACCVSVHARNGASGQLADTSRWPLCFCLYDTA